MIIDFYKKISGYEKLEGFVEEKKPVPICNNIFGFVNFYLIDWEYDTVSIEKSHRNQVRYILGEEYEKFSMATFLITTNIVNPNCVSKEKIGEIKKGLFKRKVDIFRTVPYVTIDSELKPKNKGRCDLKPVLKILEKSGYSGWIYETRKEVKRKDDSPYERLRREAMRTPGWGSEPDWDLYDLADDLERHGLYNKAESMLSDGIY